MVTEEIGFEWGERQRRFGDGKLRRGGQTSHRTAVLRSVPQQWEIFLIQKLLLLSSLLLKLEWEQLLRHGLSWSGLGWTWSHP